MSNIQGIREKLKEQEENRMGKVYAECERRGCARAFAESFIARAELYPMKQTLAFLESNATHEDHIKQWNILILVLIEQKPTSGKHDEWERCLKVLKNEH